MFNHKKDKMKNKQLQRIETKLLLSSVLTVIMGSIILASLQNYLITTIFMYVIVGFSLWKYFKVIKMEGINE